MRKRTTAEQAEEILKATVEGYDYCVAVEPPLCYWLSQKWREAASRLTTNDISWSEDDTADEVKDSTRLAIALLYDNESYNRWTKEFHKQ